MIFVTLEVDLVVMNRKLPFSAHLFRQVSGREFQKKLAYRPARLCEVASVNQEEFGSIFGVVVFAARRLPHAVPMMGNQADGPLVAEDVSADIDAKVLGDANILSHGRSPDRAPPRPDKTMPAIGSSNRSRRRWAVEIKRSLDPKPGKGFHSARADLEPERSFVVYPGTERFPLGGGVEAISLAGLAERIALEAPAVRASP